MLLMCEMTLLLFKKESLSINQTLTVIQLEDELTMNLQIQLHP